MSAVASMRHQQRIAAAMSAHGTSGIMIETVTETEIGPGTGTEVMTGIEKCAQDVTHPAWLKC